jgi:hypothetical protein
VTDSQWLTVLVVEIGRGRRVFPQVWIGAEQGVQSLADREAVLGQPDRRLEEARPGQSAILGMRHLEHPHDAGYTHGAATDDGFMKRHCLAVRLDEQSLVDRRRCRLATV